MTTAPEPAWLRAARAKLGMREAPGPANSQTILGWAKKLGTKVLGMVYNADSVPWCGLFVATCIAEAGLAPAPVAVRAKAWATWGDPVRPRVGAVLVFARDGGGHVAFYVGETDTHFEVLGGNQGDRVSIMRIARDRMIASRWPAGVPVTTGQSFVAVSAAAVSGNEA